MFLGSSTMNFGVDGEQIETAHPDLQVRVKALPGFSILQYQMLADYVVEQRPDTLVCWISEYDFFHEQQVPANRLRFIATLKQTWQLVKILGLTQLWQDRGEVADISVGPMISFWRDRDLLKQLAVYRLWTQYDISTQQQQEIETKPDDVLEHVARIKKTMMRSEFVEVGFESFERFAATVVENDIKLYVFEGITHPVAMSAYDPNGVFRSETRNRLRTLADRLDFVYVDESELPEFKAGDFADVVHFNEGARWRFSAFLADYFGKQPLGKKSE